MALVLKIAFESVFFYIIFDILKESAAGYLLFPWTPDQCNNLSDRIKKLFQYPVHMTQHQEKEMQTILVFYGSLYSNIHNSKCIWFRFLISTTT